MLAPNQVSAPATTHTSSIPAKLGTARLTSDGWTKIDAPTIVPTTIAVACVRPIDRASLDMVIARLKPSRSTFARGDRSARAVALHLRALPVRSSALRLSMAREGFSRACGMLSPDGGGCASQLLIDRLNRRERVGLGRALVFAIALDASEAERQAARVVR